jgi:hypothetical protein
MLFYVFTWSVLAFAASVFAAFGYSTSGSNYVIDTGSSNSLVFSVSTKSCDINSIKYSGTELQYQSKGSHISSGLGTATVSITTINSKNHSNMPLADPITNLSARPVYQDDLRDPDVDALPGRKVGRQYYLHGYLHHRGT